MNKQVTEEVRELEKWFNTLYTSYGWTKVRSEPDCLIFHSIPFGYCDQTERELNALIKVHNLPLVAKKNATHKGALFYDTVVVKEKYEPPPTNTVN